MKNSSFVFHSVFTPASYSWPEPVPFPDRTRTHLQPASTKGLRSRFPTGRSPGSRIPTAAAFPIAQWHRGFDHPHTVTSSHRHLTCFPILLGFSPRGLPRSESRHLSVFVFLMSAPRRSAGTRPQYSIFPKSAQPLGLFSGGGGGHAGRSAAAEPAPLASQVGPPIALENDALQISPLPDFSHPCKGNCPPHFSLRQIGVFSGSPFFRFL